MIIHSINFIKIPHCNLSFETNGFAKNAATYTTEVKSQGEKQVVVCTIGSTLEPPGGEGWCSEEINAYSGPPTIISKSLGYQHLNLK